MPGTTKSGRKRVPKALKELRGTLRKDRQNPAEPNIRAYETPPRCPSMLKGEAAKVWPKMARLLTTMRILTEADLHALEAYCSVYARWQNAETQLSSYGVMLARDGGLFPSPYLRIAEDSLKQLRSWMNEFGITPSSRSRVRVDKKPEKKDPEDWFGITGDSRN